MVNMWELSSSVISMVDESSYYCCDVFSLFETRSPAGDTGAQRDRARYLIMTFIMTIIIIIIIINYGI